MVNWARTTFSEDLPQVWLFAMGSLFILVVVAFPNGLAGIYRSYVDPWIDRRAPGSPPRQPGRPSRRSRAPHASVTATE